MFEISELAPGQQDFDIFNLRYNDLLELPLKRCFGEILTSRRGYRSIAFYDFYDMNTHKY